MSLLNLSCALESEDYPQQSYEVIQADAQNRTWFPGGEYAVQYSLSVPKEVLSGKYVFKMKLIHQERAIDIGVSADALDKKGFFSLGKIVVK